MTRGETGIDVNHPDGCRVVVRSGLSGLTRLRTDWMTLIAGVEHPTPTHYPQWYEAFLNRPDMRSKRADFLAVYRGDRLAAVFPVGFRTSRRRKLRHLCIPLAPELDILPDALIAHEEDPRQMFDVLLACLREHPSYRWDSLMVRRVLETSHLSRCMTGRRPFSVVRETAGYCCVMRLDDRRQPLLSKKFRASLRNARNRLQAIGPVEFACHVDPDAVDRAFRDYVAIEASGWKARKDHGKAGYSPGQAMSLDAAKLAFYRHLVQTFARTGHTRIYQLNVAGTAIAAQIALVLNDVCYLLKTAYADGHARLSPGHMLLERVIQHHADQGDVALINFVSDYRWLSNWQPQRLRYVSYECFNATAKGRLRGVHRHAAALWAARRLRK